MIGKIGEALFVFPFDTGLADDFMRPAYRRDS